jgi:nucleotide-binding universal stress UspA family protein
VTPAARAAHALSQRLNVPLRVVTVVEPWPYYAGAAAGLGPIVLPADGELRQASEQGVRRLLKDVLSDAAWTLDVRMGRPANEIRDFALELDATIIVTAAAPHTLLGRAVAGVRAAQVLRGAPCPVLSVDSTFRGLPRRLLAAVDFSPASIRAAQAALLLAADDARMTLVHTVPDAVFGHVGADVAMKETQALFARLREQLAPITPAGVLLETRELQGEVVQQVLDCADSLGVDLVAVGTHGPGLVQRMFLGSTAASVVHLARCSVLASPAPRFSEAIDMQLHLQGTAMVTRPDEWSELLDAVSRRNIGRRVTMEVDDRDIGAQIEASGYSLRGITFDAHDRRVAVMLEAPQGTNAHLTRSIADVDSIGITTNPDGTDRALVIKHGRGQTLLFLTD